MYCAASHLLWCSIPIYILSFLIFLICSDVLTHSHNALFLFLSIRSRFSGYIPYFQAHSVFSDTPFSEMSISPEKSSESQPSMPDDIVKPSDISPWTLLTISKRKCTRGLIKLRIRISLCATIDEAHYRALAESFHDYDYNHARGLMKVYFSFTVNPERRTHATAVQNIDGIKLLKDE